MLKQDIIEGNSYFCLNSFGLPTSAICLKNHKDYCFVSNGVQSWRVKHSELFATKEEIEKFRFNNLEKKCFQSTESINN